MRDLLLTAIVFGTIPFILRDPFIGLLAWVWLSIMNPHRFTWGFAYDMPFAMIVALCTLVSMLIHAKKLQSFPADRAAIALLLFAFWIALAPLFSFHYEREIDLWSRAIKIQLMVLVALLIVGERRQIHWLVWILAISVGIFGLKGGLFTVLTGGNFRVWGPPGSFIADNNALALALIMTVPLLRYLHMHTENRWIKYGIAMLMLLCVIAAIGSQSRGAFLAIAAMSLFLFVKSRKKGLIGILVLLALPLAWYLMPESWIERISTIKTYEQDASAMGRINAWWVAWNVAIDRFPVGGGFVLDTAEVFQRYAPDPTNIKVAHSIYFQVLGEQGFIGLALFLMVYAFAWLNGQWVIRSTRGNPAYLWAYDLASMCQVSLVGYAVGGAFLSLSYFDLPYYIVVILILLRCLIARSSAPVHLNSEPATRVGAT